MIKSLFGGSNSEDQIQNMESLQQSENNNDATDQTLASARNMTVDQALAKAHQNEQQHEAFDHKDLSKPVFPSANQVQNSTSNVPQPSAAAPVAVPQNSPIQNSAKDPKIGDKAVNPAAAQSDTSTNATPALGDSPPPKPDAPVVTPASQAKPTASPAASPASSEPAVKPAAPAPTAEPAAAQADTPISPAPKSGMAGSTEN